MAELTKDDVKAIVQEVVNPMLESAGGGNVAPAVEKAVAAAMEKVTETVTQLGEKVSAMEKAKPEGGESKGGVTLDAVQELMAKSFAERDEAAKKTAEDEAGKKAKAAAREKFIEEKAPKIPVAYHSHIPESDVEEDLKAGLAKATAAYQADAKEYGWGANVGASADAGGGDGRDVEKMSPTQKIAAGLADGE